MNVVALVNRDVGAAVRACGHTTSPSFAHGRLNRELSPLRHRLGALAQVRPDLLAVLAGHLGVPAGLPEVLAEVQARAENLLTRRLEATTRPEHYGLPRTPRRDTWAHHNGSSHPSPGR